MPSAGGLDALITMDDVKTGGSSSINEIKLSLIKPNPGQPRQEFDEESLNELAASIRELGIIQPITLRQMPDDSYQIISANADTGHRYWPVSKPYRPMYVPSKMRPSWKWHSSKTFSAKT